MLRDALDESTASTCRWPKATDAPTTLAIAELDEAGAATLPVPHGRDIRRRAVASRRSTGALAMRPRAVHLGTLGLVLEPDGVGAGAASRGSRRRTTLVMLDPNCRPAVIRDRAAYLARLERIVARADVVKVSADDLAYLAPDRLPAAAAAGHPRPRSGGRARDRRPAPGPHRHDGRCRRGPGPGGRGRRHGRCRRRVRRRVPRPLDRARVRVARTLPTARPSATRSRSRSPSRS